MVPGPMPRWRFKPHGVPLKASGRRLLARERLQGSIRPIATRCFRKPRSSVSYAVPGRRDSWPQNTPRVDPQGDQPNADEDVVAPHGIVLRVDEHERPGPRVFRFQLGEGLHLVGRRVSAFSLEADGLVRPEHPMAGLLRGGRDGGGEAESDRSAEPSLCRPSVTRVA